MQTRKQVTLQQT